MVGTWTREATLSSAESGEIRPETAAEAIERARRGDRAAFEAVYRMHVGRVHALCLRLCGERHAAEEATQEVFVKAWQRLGSFEGRSALSTWLHRLAVNVVVDRQRAARRRRLELHRDVEENAVAWPVSATPHPERSIDLERAIAALPERARLAFVLHDIEGYRHREIAEMTGKAEGTWKSQLHRARKLLREALQR